MNSENLVSAKEAAKVMGMSLASLYRLARSGRAPSFSVGAKRAGIRFSVSELKEALRRPAKDLSLSKIED